MIRKLFLVLALGALALVSVSYFGRGTARPAGLLKAIDVGGKIAYARNGGLWLYSGGNQQQLTKGPKDKQDKRDGQPTFSPDGSQIIYTRFDEGFSDLYKLTVADPSDTVALTNHRPTVETGAIGYNTEALWAMQPAWSPDGQTIAFTSDVGTEYPGLFTMNTLGGNVRKIVDNLDHSKQAVENPSWSPDGTKIAVANYVTDSGNGQILVLNLETGKKLELTDAKDSAYDPAWSPDGQWLAFAMQREGKTNIYIVPTDAQKWTGDYPAPIQLTTDGASRAPAWSPDGGKLAYIALKDASFDLYAADFQAPLSAGKANLSATQKLTDNANVDAQSGLSWGK
ncbi:MAG: PD40 domain-containing protein [Chloroflexi bacterium]|nr:PD40 domain-containing protein [Chloroflexota bacterium]